MTTTTTTPKKTAARKRTAVPAPTTPASAGGVLDALDVGAASIPSLPLDLLDPHPHNPRRDLGDLVELADSMRAHGVRQNLLVVPSPTTQGRYQVVIGHRRRAAAIAAGLDRVPAVVDHDLTDAQQLELMLIENIQRQDLTPVEEADGYQGLLDLGVDVAHIAARTGRSESTVRRRLALVALPEHARTAVHLGQATLEDAAAVADFEGTDDERAAVAAALGTADFAMTLSRIKTARERRELFAVQIARLTAAGATEAPANAELRYPAWSNVVWLYSTTSPADVERFEQATAEDLTGWVFKVSHLLDVYRPRTEAEQQPTRLPEDPAAAAARQAEQEAFQARQAHAAEVAAAATPLRAAFVADLLTATKLKTAVTDTLLTLGTKTLLAAAADDGIYTDDLTKTLGVSSDPDDYPTVDEDDEDALDEAITAALAARVAELSPAQRILTLAAVSHEPVHGHSWRHLATARWYALLEALGYQVSSDERALLAGES